MGHPNADSKGGAVIDGPLESAGGELDRVAVSLRVVSASLPHERITQLLGLSPTSVNVYLGKNIWVRKTPSAGRTLDQAIRELVESLPATPKMWEFLNKEADLVLSCGLFLDAFNRGTVVSPAPLEELGRRQIALSLDIYCTVA